MLQSKLFTRTKKQLPKEAEFISHKLLLKGDFIDQLTSGVFSFLTLGFLVLKRIENIIRQEIKALGAQEILLPALQPKSLWEETGRWKTIDPPLFKFCDRHQKELALGSTHEEVIFDLVRRRVFSYRDLPFALFQIQDKFRNEMRSSGGLLRTREFVMKDLYSFHKDENDLNKYYNRVFEAYKKIYKRCGIEALPVEASGGTIGGKITHEFMVIASCGEDRILVCEKCHASRDHNIFAANLEIGKKYKECPKCGGKLLVKNGIEVGHIFQLGTEYSKKMKAEFIDQNGKKKLIWAGCYGIGLGRLMATVVEVNHDDLGIIWPRDAAPFDLHLVSLQPQNKKVKFAAENLYQTLSSHQKVNFRWGDLQKENIDVLYDDRDLSPGEKLKDTDLIGVPKRIVVSERTVEKNAVEYKERAKKESQLIKIKDVFHLLK
ncbi:MAG: aminoacyl--tRNA ligase-related protein [Patescibacteria group bacterium]